MAGKRIDYIDVAKGILILIVILYHSGFLPENDLIVLMRIKTMPFYSAWYMTSFFMITGYCSNFDKPFKPFLVNNLKTLMWPAVVGTTVICLLRTIVTLDITVLTNYVNKIPIGGFNWFLTALFFSKLIFWAVRHISSNLLFQCVILLMFCYIGVYANDINLFGDNWFHYRHFFYMTIFLFLGNVTKIKRSHPVCVPWYVGCVSMLFILLVLKTIGDRFGIAGNYMYFNVILIPLQLFMSIAGIIFVISLAQLLVHNKCLLYIGRNSLAFYIVHLLALDIIIALYLNFFFINSKLDVIVFFVVVVILTTVLSLLFVELLKTKYFSWMIKIPERFRK